MKKNKKNLIIAGIVVVLVVAATSIYLLTNRASQEEKLSKSLKEMGSEFYESFYFEHVTSSMSESESNAFFDQFKEIGIKVNLDSLSVYNNNQNADKVKQFVNSKTGNACNTVNTRAIIYPVAPYKNTSYTIEVELDCGFSTPSE